MSQATITVDANALRQVLHALLGPTHHVAELQATRTLHSMGGKYTNPIETLWEQFKAGGVTPAPATTSSSPLGLEAVPAMTTEQLALFMLGRKLEWVRIAAKKPDANLETCVQLDVSVRASDLLDVARKHGLLPPALDTQPPPPTQKPSDDARWKCLVCGSNRPGHHGAMEDGTPCTNGKAGAA
ncbi:hypothetical protein [Acidovorax sp. PRC11]|uniref:hypothetical protein n=1 Tax=Acidovorax sp. PRC11 TaxID=2962592 RepID=UPI002881AB88|nr:hypothetical protein [Acidovorax sp. PRC11]MDT0138061.1 hypothetical protein [Acidovorax sp. PRC11]